MIKDLNQLLRGWMQYFRLAEVKGVFEELDGWLQRKLRCLLWRHWKRPGTRAKNLMKRGLEKHARGSRDNGRGAWWNAGASHMNEAFPKSYFDRSGTHVTAGSAAETSIFYVNRRMRNRTSGGVGGREP